MVFAGMSGSRRDQPIEFKESRKDVEAMLAINDLPRNFRQAASTELPCNINAPVKVKGSSRKSTDVDGKVGDPQTLESQDRMIDKTMGNRPCGSAAGAENGATRGGNGRFRAAVAGDLPVG